MKKSKSKRRTGMILVTFFLILCVYIPMEILVYFHQYKEKGTYIFRDYYLVSANDTYVGMIDMDNSKVRITTHSGTEVSCVDTSDTEEGRPDQIALGDTSYYLLYQGTVGERDSRIIQYDYQSGKKKECTIPDIATIACHDGYLFLGEWQYEEDIEDRYFYFVPCSNSFHANSYIMEKNFGAQPEALIPDQTGRCRIGKTEQYAIKGNRRR